MLTLLVALTLAQPPKTLAIHGSVFDGDRWLPNGTAVLISGQTIQAVGPEAKLRKLAGSNFATLDLAGKALVPGFNDAHLHPSPLFPEESPYAQVWLDPSRTPTMESLVARLKWKASLTPKGQWVRGYGYQETKLGRVPTRQDLDEASTGHPIYITHSSGHVAVCNSYALKMAGVDRNTPTPGGGVIGHDVDGEPNGFLGESAQGLVRGKGPKSPQANAEETQSGLVNCLLAYAAKGITSAGVAGTDPSTLQTYRSLAKQGRLPVRMNVMISEGNWKWLADEWKKGDRGEPMVRMGDVKLFHGNSLSGNTCWISRPRTDGNLGVPPARTQETLNKLVLDIQNAGLRACTHSNGDREIAMVLTAVEEAAKADPRADVRHRIEHCSVVTPELLERIRKDKVVIVVHSYEWEHGDKMAKYGADWWDWMCPNGSAVRMGIPLAGHSDSPVSAADPMLRVQSMVTRMSAEGNVYGPTQKISLNDALHVWTVGSAYSTHEEKSKGRLAPGFLADFVVLGQDPRKVAATKLRSVPVLMTVMGGKTVFEAKKDGKLAQARQRMLAATMVGECD